MSRLHELNTRINFVRYIYSVICDKNIDKYNHSSSRHSDNSRLKRQLELFHTFENEQHFFKEDMLLEFLEIYHTQNNQKKIIEQITAKSSNHILDDITMSILIAAISEFIQRKYNHKIIISQYLQVAKTFNVHTKFINGILDKIYFEHYDGNPAENETESEIIIFSNHLETKPPFITFH